MIIGEDDFPLTKKVLKALLERPCKLPAIQSNLVYDKELAERIMKDEHVNITSQEDTAADEEGPGEG